MCPYLNNEQIHGGKIRSREIALVLKKEASSFETKFLKPDPHDSMQTSPFLGGLPLSLVGDVNLLFNDFGKDFYPDFDPDIIIFEQPWLWNEVLKLRKKFPNVKLIYSSHNIEHQLKDSIFLDANINDGGKVSSFIRDLENEILNSVDEVWATCEFDARYFHSQSNIKIRVFQNGASQIMNSDVLASPLNAPFLLVVGSGHPPNIAGLKYYLADLDKWMTGYGKLVVVGSLALSVQEFFENSLQNGDIVLIPSASNALLRRLISSCSAILLPVMYGAGTNLKTAEALVSDRKIISTKAAMRGYENFVKEAGVFVTDNAMEFKILSIGALLGDHNASFVRNDSAALHWRATLQDLNRSIRELIK